MTDGRDDEEGTEGSTRALAKRGRDELEFMGSRAESTPLDRATIDAHLTGLRSRVVTRRRHRGREVHELGTTLNTLYMRHADAVLDKQSFADLLAEQWQDDLEEAKGCMIVARFLTVDQAEEHGYWKSLYAVRLMKKLGLVTFDALEKRTFDLPRGSRIAFKDLSVGETKDLSALRPPKALEEPPGRAVVKLRKRASELQERREDYADLTVRISPAEGQPRVTVTSTGRDGSEAARRFLADLWKT